MRKRRKRKKNRKEEEEEEEERKEKTNQPSELQSKSNLLPKKSKSSLHSQFPIS
jgi:hypothetical protein